MTEETLTYESAMTRLEAMARAMEADNVPIDELAAKLKEAQQLLAFCKAKLTKADEEIKKLLEENTTNIES